MDGSLVSQIWCDVSDRVGDDLRVVTWYEPLDFETKMRDDVRTQYSSIDDSRIVDDTILSQLVAADTEDSFKTGELQGIVRIFDDAWILAWPDANSKKSGVIVSIQRDSEQTSMADIEWCVEYLDEEVAPLVG